MDNSDQGAANNGNSGPRSLTERLKAEVNGYEDEIELPEASFMAERFAPGADAAINAKRREGRTSPLLLGALIAVALLPTAVLGLLLLDGAVEIPWTKFMPDSAAPAKLEPPKVQQASVASSTVLETVLPKGDVELPRVALSLPSSMNAEAGKEASFAVSLDSEEALPARTIVTISGLPSGTVFSAGRPFGETEWSLRPDEIGDLRIQPPLNASGERSLSIQLITADGRTIAAADTRLDIAPDPKAALVLRPDDASRIGELIDHGNKMIEVGYLAGARSYFKRAAEAGSADAALAVGATYDPRFIAQIGAQGIKPEPDEARSWYERAKLLGNPDADAKLGALANYASESNAGPADRADASDDASEAVAAVSADGSATDAPEWIEIESPVNVRAAPTADAETLKIAQPGARYQATGRKGRWVQVTDPTTSEVGWVYSRFIVSSDASGR